ncbi:hypothetical protein ACO0LI_10410 [Undibacterium sp. Tian12W]
MSNIANNKPQCGAEYNGMLAILPNGKQVSPNTHSGGFHGTRNFAPSQVFITGIPKKGTDRRLKEHCDGNDQSAFRGTTIQILHTPDGPGAALFAQVGGWVYEIEKVPTWDTVQQLQGRVPSVTGFGNCPTAGELEFAIPAIVEPYRIVRAAEIVAGRGTRVKVGKWHPNPNF